MTENTTTSGATARYTKKPVTITASQWFKNGDHPEDAVTEMCEYPSVQFLGYMLERPSVVREGKVVRYYWHPAVTGDSLCEQCGKKHHVHGWIDTLEQGHRVCPGDWIITGVKGERYPCKPDIFEATYYPALAASARVAPAQPVDLQTFADAVKVGIAEHFLDRMFVQRYTVEEYAEMVKSVEINAEMAAAAITTQAAPVAPTPTVQAGVTPEQRRIIDVIADKIEDGTLFQSGIYSKRDLARFVRNMLTTTPQAVPAAPAPQPVPGQLPQMHAAVRTVLKHHGLTQHGDGVVEADLIAAVCDVLAPAPKAAPAEQEDAAIQAAWHAGLDEGRAQARTAPVCHPVIAGALFDFLGYLTTLVTPVSFGSAEYSGPAVEHLQIWAKRRGLELAEAKVMGWSEPAAPAPVTDPWHQAVLSACMSVESCYVEADPEKTVAQLIDWHAHTAEIDALRCGLRGAITSLETLARSAGQEAYTGKTGHMGAYAASRARVARAHLGEEALAAPAAQEARVPLSEDQIDEIHLANSDAYERGAVEYESHGFARAVEAAHGITAAQKETP